MKDQTVFSVTIPEIEFKSDSCTLTSEIDGQDAWVRIYAPHAVLQRITPTIYPFVPISIFRAMLSSKDILIESEIDDAWLAKLSMCFAPLIAAIFEMRRPIILASRRGQNANSQGSIQHEFINSIEPGLKSCGLMFSGGVDSFYSRSLLKKIDIRYSYFININAGAHDSNYKLWQLRSQNIIEVAKHDNVDTILIDTNFHHIIPIPHIRAHVIRNLCAAFALGPAVPDIYYSSGDFSFKEISFISGKKQLAALDHTVLALMSPSLINATVLGSDATRIEKINEISKDRVAQAFLDICTNADYQSQIVPGKPMNCGMCNKCIKTIHIIEALGLLEKFFGAFNVVNLNRDQRGAI